MVYELTLEGVGQQWKRFGKGTVLRREVEGHPQHLPLATALWVVVCARPFEWVRARAEPPAWGESRQLRQHVYTLSTRPRRALLGLEYGQQAMLCL